MKSGYCALIAFASLLAACTTGEPRPDPRRTEPRIGTVSRGGVQDIPVTPLEAPITAEQNRAVHRTLAPCWAFDPGMMDAKNLAVDVRVYLKPEGAVFRTELVEPSLISRSPQYRAAAMSALRAPMNPACNKLPLRSDREFSLIISFDPKDMGQ